MYDHKKSSNGSQCDCFEHWNKITRWRKLSQNSKLNITSRWCQKGSEPPTQITETPFLVLTKTEHWPRIFSGSDFSSFQVRLSKSKRRTLLQSRPPTRSICFSETIVSECWTDRSSSLWIVVQRLAFMSSMYKMPCNSSEFHPHRDPPWMKTRWLHFVAPYDRRPEVGTGLQF